MSPCTYCGRSITQTFGANTSADWDARVVRMSEDEMDAEREALLDLDPPTPDVPNDPYPVQPDDPQPVEDPEK